MTSRYLVSAAALLLFVWPFGSGGKSYALHASPLAAGATATVKLGRDRNGNTTVDIRVKHLAHPTQLTPAYMEYVVWIEPNGRPAENRGLLRVNAHLRARFQTLTPYRDFRILITAENNAQAAQPSGEVVLQGAVSR